MSVSITLTQQQVDDVVTQDGRVAQLQAALDSANAALAAANAQVAAFQNANAALQSKIDAAKAALA